MLRLGTVIFSCSDNQITLQTTVQIVADFRWSSSRPAYYSYRLTAAMLLTKHIAWKRDASRSGTLRTKAIQMSTKASNQSRIGHRSFWVRGAVWLQQLLADLVFRSHETELWDKTILEYNPYSRGPLLMLMLMFVFFFLADSYIKQTEQASPSQLRGLRTDPTRSRKIAISTPIATQMCHLSCWKGLYVKILYKEG